MFTAPNTRVRRGWLATVLGALPGLCGKLSGAALGAAHVEPSRDPHVEGERLAAEQAVHSVEAREFHQGTRGLLVALRQGEHLSGLEGQVPAAVADPFGLGDLRFERRRRFEQRSKRYNLPPRTGTGNLHNSPGVRRRNRFELVAGRIDQDETVGL